MLTVPQVAERLGLSKSQVYDLIKYKKLDACQFGTMDQGGPIRIDESDLQSYINQSKIKNKQAKFFNSRKRKTA